MDNEQTRMPECRTINSKTTWGLVVLAKVKSVVLTHGDVVITFKPPPPFMQPDKPTSQYNYGNSVGSKPKYGNPTNHRAKSGSETSVIYVLYP